MLPRCHREKGRKESYSKTWFFECCWLSCVLFLSHAWQPLHYHCVSRVLLVLHGYRYLNFPNDEHVMHLQDVGTPRQSMGEKRGYHGFRCTNQAGHKYFLRSSPPSEWIHTSHLNLRILKQCCVVLYPWFLVGLPTPVLAESREGSLTWTAKGCDRDGRCSRVRGWF